jgi:hypothetical protein
LLHEVFYPVSSQSHVPIPQVADCGCYNLRPRLIVCIQYWMYNYTDMERA